MDEHDPAKVRADFHLKEYEFLRREIDGLQTSLRANEMQAVFGTVAVWTWLATQAPPAMPPVFSFAWWLPLGVVCLCFVRNMSFLEGMFRLSRQMADIERELKVRGWETIQGEQWPQPFWKQILKGPYRYTYLASVAFWIGLGIATIIVPILVRR